jgi:hypothetical protein
MNSIYVQIKSLHSGHLADLHLAAVPRKGDKLTTRIRVGHYVVNHVEWNIDNGDVIVWVE